MDEKTASKNLENSRGALSSKLGAAEFRQSELCGKTAGESLRLCNVNIKGSMCNCQKTFNY